MYRRYKTPLFRNPANVGYIRAEPSNAILENCILPKYNKPPAIQKKLNIRMPTISLY